MPAKEIYEIFSDEIVEEMNRQLAECSDSKQYVEGQKDFYQVENVSGILLLYNCNVYIRNV